MFTAFFALQKPLPKLPLPNLQSTFAKYLRCITPIVTDDKYKKTEALVKDFIRPDGLGEKLQNILTEINEKRDNWVWCGQFNLLQINIQS
jgi:carnitine O-acetyltransferase